jgi:hypothetical protein
LKRSRALYLKKVSEGAVNNPCYLALDATRPGGSAPRFYVICEATRTFRAVPSGHGSRLKLEGIANFANGIRCAKNFSNAMDSKLTTGGPYATAEIKMSFKGYYRDSGGELVPLLRSFVQFDGTGETANVRPRAIGGHPGVILSPICRLKVPGNPYAEGIKMTGMPAWGVTHDDELLWDVVAFVRKLPELTPEHNIRLW